MNPQRMLSTSEFAEATGMSESSIRRLADRGELRIKKTSGGHRKIPVSEAIRYARDCNLPIARPELLGLGLKEVTADRNTTVHDALMAGDGELTARLLQALYLGGKSIAEICDGPVTEAMGQIGNTWPQERRSIFIEHRATVVCLRALCQIRLAMPSRPEGSPKAIGAAPTGDPYLLPSMMASLVLFDAGFEDINLGPDTPVDVLFDAIEDEQPRIVWLALSTPIRSRSQLLEMERLQHQAQQHHCELVLGGRYAEMVELPGATICRSMTELHEFASGRRGR